MCLTFCPLCGPGSIAGHGRVFQGILPGSNSPQWHHTTCGHQGGRPFSNHRQKMPKQYTKIASSR